MLKPGLSIVMPCLNEERTIVSCILKAKESLKKLKLDGEVIIADNGSTDQSVELAEANGARVVHVTDKGYGSALRGGIDASEFEYVIMGDADDSYDFLNIDGFVQKLDEGYELVMGNRFKGGIEPGAMSFSHRYIGNPILSGIGKAFFKTEISDFHCGLRAFRKESIISLGLSTTGMEFASEMVVKAVLFELKMTEIPCKLYPDGRNRAPHLRSIPDGLRHLEFLLLYSPKWLFAYPGMILSLIGLFFTILIYFRPIRIGEVQFDVTTMFYASVVMLLGTQMLQFSVFTSLFAQRVGQFPKTLSLANKISAFVNKRGYIIGTILLLVNMMGIISSFVAWGNNGFGMLDTTVVCKTAVLFGSLFILGMEVILFTLFTRVLHMGGKIVEEETAN